MRPIMPDVSRAEPKSRLLRIECLSVGYACAATPALSQVDFEIAPGEIVGILGESGSGKSTLALSILGLLPETARVEGSIQFKNQELLSLNESQWRAIRGASISLIHQEPGLSLSPVMRVGSQVAEVIRAHRCTKRGARRQEAEAALREVWLQDGARIYDAYPHQLSGGQLHRVAIAQALACRPELVISDESTRSLDVTIQAGILKLLRQLHEQFGMALIFITHNPALLAGFADRVVVMHAGGIVEEGRAATVFSRPAHAYTKRLLQFMSGAVGRKTADRLVTV